MSEHELFHKYNKGVYRTCLYMLKNFQDAEEVCHDVFKNRLLHKQEVLSNDPVDTIVMAKLSFAELEQQLQRLPDKLLSVMTLRYIGDLSVAEIAETLGVRQATVRTMLHKALKVMRKKLEIYDLYRLPKWTRT